MLRSRIFLTGLLATSLLLSIYVGSRFLQEEVSIQDISLDLSCLKMLNEQNMGRLHLLEEYEENYGYGVTSIQFSSDGSLLGSSNIYGLSVLDFQSKRRIHFPQPHQTDFVFSSDNRLVVTRGSSRENKGGLRIWDVKSASILYIIENEKSVYNMAISSDNRYLAFAMDSGAYIIDIQKGDWQRHLISEEKVYSLAFNPLNRDEILLGTSTHLMIFNVAQIILTKTDIVPQPTLKNEDIVFSPYTHLVLSPDGTRLFKWDNTDHSISIWNLETEERELNISSVSSLNIAIIDWGRSLLAYNKDSDLIIVNFETGEEKQRLIAHKRLIYDISFHPIEPLLVSNSNDATIKIWDYETGQELRSLLLEYADMYTVRFNSQGTLLAFVKKSNLQVWGYKNCS